MAYHCNQLEPKDEEALSSPGTRFAYLILAAEDRNLGYFALFYELVDDYLARRGAFRDEHLRLARESYGRGEIVLAGAFSEPADSALLVFRAADASIAKNFAEHDPYVLNGLVKRWKIRPWIVAIGADR